MWHRQPTSTPFERKKLLINAIKNFKLQKQVQQIPRLFIHVDDNYNKYIHLFSCSSNVVILEYLRRHDFIYVQLFLVTMLWCVCGHYGWNNNEPVCTLVHWYALNSWCRFVYPINVIQFILQNTCCAYLLKKSFLSSSEYAFLLIFIHRKILLFPSIFLFK